MTRQELMTNITHRYDWLFDKALSLSPLSLSLAFARILVRQASRQHERSVLQVVTYASRFEEFLGIEVSVRSLGWRWTGRFLIFQVCANLCRELRAHGL